MSHSGVAAFLRGGFAARLLDRAAALAEVKSVRVRMCTLCAAITAHVLWQRKTRRPRFWDEILGEIVLVPTLAH